MVAVLHVGMPLGFTKNTLLILQELQYLFFINPICYSTICIFS